MYIKLILQTLNVKIFAFKSKQILVIDILNGKFEFELL